MTVATQIALTLLLAAIASSLPVISRRVDGAFYLAGLLAAAALGQWLLAAGGVDFLRLGLAAALTLPAVAFIEARLARRRSRAGHPVDARSTRGIAGLGDGLACGLALAVYWGLGGAGIGLVIAGAAVGVVGLLLSSLSTLIPMDRSHRDLQG